MEVYVSRKVRIIKSNMKPSLKLVVSNSIVIHTWAFMTGGLDGHQIIQYFDFFSLLKLDHVD